MSWAAAMTSRPRPRRRLPPRAVAPGEAARPVTDCGPGADCGMGAHPGGSGALSAPVAGDVDVTVSPWVSKHVPWRPCEPSRWAQVRRQPGERSSPDPGDSPPGQCRTGCSAERPPVPGPAAYPLRRNPDSPQPTCHTHLNQPVRSRLSATPRVRRRGGVWSKPCSSRCWSCAGRDRSRAPWTAGSTAPGYDADRIVVAFSARLKDAVDQGAVRDDLAVVVQQALEPAHVSVWVNEHG